MARYNREFLVPYLENLCALHIAKWKIETKCQEIKNKQNELNYQIYMLKEPEEPVLCDMGMQIGGLVTGVILVIISFFNILIISFLAGLLGWFLTIVYGIWLYKVKSDNETIERSYSSAVYAYNQKLWELRKKEDDYGIYAFAHYSLYEERKKEIDSMLQKVYQANIIPRRYRDIYVAVYLYDWFSTSMADDLDTALNTYVLEKIKDKLDQIINQLAESLLNQRMIIENQKKTIEQQERHHKEMMGRLECLQLTAEEQNCYLNMIEANTAVSAFFSAADYIRDL